MCLNTCVNKKNIIVNLLILISILAGITWYAVSIKIAPAVTSLEYKNSQYGFRFLLPITWKRYTVTTSPWKGYAVDSRREVPTENGPTISIRHPLWTTDVPRQDIPIMVFTTAQWDSLQQDEFHIGAAPIGPRELGRNNLYVFALPARYNFAFPVGYEEVDTILGSNSFRAF